MGLSPLRPNSASCQDLDATFSTFAHSSDCNAGISFKTQALYATVFITRYLDLFYEWVSLYNFTMKVFFIASSCYILYLMKVKFRSVPFFTWSFTPIQAMRDTSDLVPNS